MRTFLSQLGPGLLYAGAAVGVSHLVQSTRAGALYGGAMVFVVLIANWIKYPFFKAGPTYAAAEGKSLLEAFQLKGNWAMALFYLVTLTAMFTVQAVVTLLTASVFSSIFNLTLPLWITSSIILLVCGGILFIGKYNVLDKLMKTVITLLAITTLVTLVAALIHYEPIQQNQSSFSFLENTDVFFLIALIGWMPAPLDIALWHSEWTLTASHANKTPLDVKKSLFDFNVGYWGTALLAAAFVGLGTLILRANASEIPAGGVAFSGQLIKMYTSVLGQWAFIFIAIAALTTMFSTTLTVLDAYPRTLKKAIQLSFKGKVNAGYLSWLVLLIIGAILILIFQLENMKQLVDFATTISFLTAPLLASLIYKVVKESKAKIFSKSDNFLAWIGLLFLYCFSLYYLWIKFFS